MKLFPVGVLLVTCLLTLVIMLGLFSNANASRGENDQGSTEASTHSGLGMPAIQPTLSTGEVRFTVQDVQAYLQKHPFPSGPTTTGKAAIIRTIDFITSKDASLRLHGASIGLADTDIVCYVELYGPFSTTKVSLPPGAKPLPPSDLGVEVFDALTGNRLMWWIA